MTNDDEHMAEAVRLARRGIYSTHPNPNVGCVIVNQGVVCGRGWHQLAGGSHAEVFALREAGERAHGATVYITLEPCSHQGRTPPCCDALIEAGISRVMVAMQDPNPLVSGQGLQRLREAGIEVDVGLQEQQARQLNPGFIRRMQGGLPWLRCKLASSLDGRTAMACGESQWITGEAAREDVQRLRARSSAIVTGIGTLLADDPSMNVRLAPADLHGVEPLRQPLRVVMDSRLRFPPSARMLPLPGDTLVVTASSDAAAIQELQDAGAQVLQVPVVAGKLELKAVLQLLADRGINEILLECGPMLAGSFLQQGLIDELILYVAPHVMGNAARGLFELPGLERMKERIGLQWTDVRRVGDDLRITVRPLTES